MNPHDPNPPEDELPATEHFSATPHEPGLTRPISLSRLRAPRNESADPLPRYTRIGIHARGGLGEVFRALDEELPREVALKEIRADRDDDQSRARFLMEGTITGSLEHPGIVPVYSFGAHADGRPFYAMRMIRGQTMQQAIAEFHGCSSDQSASSSGNAKLGHIDFSSVSFRQLLQRLVVVCRTLHYAHDRKLIHRDLKPANIMVGSYGETLVVDWGLAKILGSADEVHEKDSAAVAASSLPGETLPGQALGTPAYMSPEQAAGAVNELTPATDVYALGATLYQLLTGQHPLVQPGRLTDPLERAKQGDIAPPQSVLPHIPPPLQAICQKAMAPMPTDRYTSAGDLADDLERWLADEPLRFYRDPLFVRGGRWLRKHPGQAATGFTSLTLLFVAAVVVSAITSSYSRQLSTANGKLSTSHNQLAQANDDLKRVNVNLIAAREVATENANTARQNEKEANAREAETKAVLDFVETRIFAAARPAGQDGGLGRNVLLRDAVTAAASYAESSFGGQPMVQVRVRRSLGTSLLYFGDADEALRQYECARQLLTTHRGRFHRDTMSTASSVGLCYFENGELQKARDLLEKTLASQKEHLGEKSPDVFDTMHTLAIVYEDLGRQPEALKLREATLRERLAVLGPEHPDTLKSKNNLAYSYLDQGRLDEALKTAKEVVATKRDVFGPAHPETLGSMYTLANMYSAMGKNQDALRLREETLKAITEKLGPEHHAATGAMHNLANSYAATGRLSDALKLYEEAVASRKRKLGADDPRTLETMEALALHCANIGRLPEAIRLGQETLASRRNVLGPNHPHTINSMRHLGLTFARARRSAEALPLFEEAFRRSRDQFGASHPHTLDRMFDLAITYTTLDRVHEAQAIREQEYQLRKRQPGGVQASTLLSMNSLAQSYITLGRGKEAEALLQETLKLRRQYLAEHPRQADARGYFAVTLGQLGESQQLQLDFTSANESFVQCFEAFEKLGQEGAATTPYFESRRRHFQLQMKVCAKTDEAVDNIASIAAQSPPEIPLLLTARLRVLANRRDVAGVIATAKLMDMPPRKARVSAYRRGAAWSIASSLSEDPQLREQYATFAIERLRRVKPIAGGQFASPLAQSYAFHYNPDLAALRERDDFQALLRELPAVDQNPLTK